MKLLRPRSAPSSGEDMTCAGGNITGHGPYIILSEEVEGQNIFVVLDVEGPGGLKVALEGDRILGAERELLGGADWRNCLWFCWADMRGALRDRPPW